MSLRDELLRVRAERGVLTPANVVEDARPDGSPLHHRFEWDDSIAAESYRRAQAADLIREVRVTYAAPSGESRSVRAFVSTRPAGESLSSAYEPTEEAMADPFTSQLLLRMFRRDWEAFKSRYEQLAEFRDVVLGDVSEVA